jgi:hypothetical protein
VTNDAFNHSKLVSEMCIFIEEFVSFMCMSLLVNLESNGRLYIVCLFTDVLSGTKASF